MNTTRLAVLGVSIALLSLVAVVDTAAAATRVTFGGGGDDPCNGAIVSTNCDMPSGYECSYAVWGICVIDFNSVYFLA